nr:DNA-directed RNA polymerase III subunit RPC8 isoform X1 [Anser cygnoides]
MFVLVEMTDTVRIPPWQFERKLNESIAEELNKKLANKVVYNVGLCICLYDITKLEDSYIFPGDGASHTKVHFRYVVFHPFLDEILIGEIKSCSQDGVHGVDQRTRPGPPVMVDEQLAAVRACSAARLSGGYLGDYGILLVLAAPLKLNENSELPSSVSPSASNLPDQDSRFQEMPSLIRRSEFAGTKRPEPSSNKPSWGFGLLPWRESWGGLYSPELRRELDFSE